MSEHCGVMRVRNVCRFGVEDSRGGCVADTAVPWKAVSFDLRVLTGDCTNAIVRGT